MHDNLPSTHVSGVKPTKAVHMSELFDTVIDALHSAPTTNGSMRFTDILQNHFRDVVMAKPELTGKNTEKNIKEIAEFVARKLNDYLEGYQNEPCSKLTFTTQGHRIIVSAENATSVRDGLTSLNNKFETSNRWNMFELPFEIPSHLPLALVENVNPTITPQRTR